MQNRKIIFAVCMVLCGIIMLCGCGIKNESAVRDNRPVLVIGSDKYEPYIYADDYDAYEGIDVEIANEACRRIGYCAEFKIIDWEEKDKYLSDNEIDCLWGSFSMNGREDKYQWAGPYLTSRQVVVVRGDSNIYDLSDLNGANVAVQTTTKPEKIFLEHTDPDIPIPENVYSFTKTEEEFAALRKGYVDACAAHERRIKTYIKTAPSKYRILEQELMTSKLGVAFSKDFDSGVVNRIDAALNEMKNDGTIDEIVKKYD